jgi:hypothetical protein
MARHPEPETSLTLLARLRDTPADQGAWGAFVARYGRKIYGWCRHWGLQEADAEDVTQVVLPDGPGGAARRRGRRATGHEGGHGVRGQGQGAAPAPGRGSPAGGADPGRAEGTL